MIETERLILKPMNSDDLRLNISDPASLDKKWSLKSLHCSDAQNDEHVRDAYEYRIEMVLKHPDSYLWYTNWALILKKESVIIGGIMIISEPDINGEVEFGYGTDTAYQKHGYMTEAVGALAGWAFRNPDVKYIIAETDKDNTASHRVLIKNRFEKYKETEDGFWWRVNKKGISNILK